MRAGLALGHTARLMASGVPNQNMFASSRRRPAGSSPVKTESIQALTSRGMTVIGSRRTRGALQLAGRGDRHRGVQAEPQEAGRPAPEARPADLIPAHGQVDAVGGTGKAGAVAHPVRAEDHREMGPDVAGPPSRI
jgi:hypothetical protein